MRTVAIGDHVAAARRERERASVAQLGADLDGAPPRLAGLAGVHGRRDRRPIDGLERDVDELHRASLTHWMRRRGMVPPGCHALPCGACATCAATRLFAENNQG